MSSLQQGLSGLTAASKSLDVIGNNIANASTVGFKSSQAQFADMYAASVSSNNQIGIGTNLAAVAQQFNQGTLTTTNNALDVAVNGNGFFRLSGNRSGNVGEISYTRNGQFQLNKDGYIVANSGLHLTGYQATSGVVGSKLGDIQIDTSDMSPKTSTGIAITANFDARSVAPTGTFPTTLSAVVPATNPPTYEQPTADTYNKSTSITVYDTLGNSHVETLYFSKSTPASAAAAAVSPSAAAAAAPNVAAAVAAVTANSDPVNAAILNPIAVAAAALGGATPASVAAAVAANAADALAAGVSAAAAVLAVAPVTMDAFTGNDVNAALSAAAAAEIAAPTAPLLVATPASISAAVTKEAAATATDATAMVAAANGANSAANALIAVNAVVGTSLNGAASGVPPAGGILKNAATAAAALPGATAASVAAAVAAAAAKVAAGAAGAFANNWNIKAILDGGQYTTGGVMNFGTVTFDTSGKLSSVSRQDVTSPTIGMTGLVGAGWTSGAWDPTQRIAIDLSGLSQYGSNYGVTALNQDGYASGRMNGIDIDQEGFIQASYTNGKTQLQGQIALANFANAQGLKPIGNNQWTESLSSGSPVVGTPGSGTMGVLQSKATEDSNTDLTQELVGMITAQRVYQANAQTIKTQDQVMQTLVNLK